MDKPHNLNALIRIEDAIKVLCRKTCNPGVFCPDTYCDEMWDALADIERVDAIQIVRCGECRYWDRYPSCSATPQYHACKRRIFADVYTTRDDFCSQGERKDSEANENH